MFYVLGYRLVQRGGEQAASSMLGHEIPYESYDPRVSRKIWHPLDGSVTKGYGEENYLPLNHLCETAKNSKSKSSIELDYEIRLIELWVDLSELYMLELQEITNGLVLFHRDGMEINNFESKELGFEVIENLSISALHNMWHSGTFAQFHRNFFRPFVNTNGLLGSFEQARCLRDCLPYIVPEDAQYYIVRLSNIDWRAIAGTG